MRELMMMLIISLISPGNTVEAPPIDSIVVDQEIVIEQEDGEGPVEEIEDGLVEEAVEETQEITPVDEFNKIELVLKKGISSEEVHRLRRFLREKGYSTGDSFYFDSELESLVKRYQSNNGLEVDGKVGPKTTEFINSDMKQNGINIPEMEVKLSGDVPDGIWIIINKTNNTLYHMFDSHVVKKYPVATGETSEKTPEGKFTVVVKAVNPYWGGAGKYTPVRGGAPNNPLGKRWMGLSIGGGGTYGVHGNAAPTSIGTYASMGCVRMRNADVEYLFDLVPRGTPVWIGQEGKLTEFGVELQ